MPRRRYPSCTPSQRMQLNVSRPLTKVLLNFPTPLQPVFHLRFACVPPSFPPVGKPQSIADAGSAQGECGGASGKTVQPNPAFNRPLQALMRHSPSSSPAPTIFLL